MQYHVISGASRGVGAALVEQLLTPTASVFGISRTTPDQLVDRARRQGLPLHWLPADLRDPSGADSLIDSIAATVGDRPPEIAALWVAAATLDPIGPVGTLDSAAVDAALRLNLAAAITLTQRFVAGFAGFGCPLRVVLLSSGASERVMPGLSVYSAAKAGLNAFARSAQDEAVRSGLGDVAIYSISPGLVDTGMQETLRTRGTDRLPERDQYRSWRADGRLASPAAVAARLATLVNRDDLPAGRYLHIDDL